MRTSLGISAGNEVVCSALVATAPNGAQSFDYRVVSADAAHSDLGDLVASSIELMTTRMPTRDVVHPAGAHTAGLPALHPETAAGPPGAIAVAYRDREQAVAIRSAIGRQRRDVQLIPESTAALTYLRHTGLLDRFETVAIIDLGASGMTVTVADLADDTTLRSERTATVSGTAVDELIYHHLLDCHFARRGTRPNRGMLINRSRAAKEHLSIAPAVTIDHVAGQPLKLTRADFEELIADLVREAAVYASGVFARSPKLPQAVAVIGGGANIPTVVAGLDELLDVPVLTVPEPEAATAKGAALVADSAQPSAFPVISLGGDSSAGTFTKLVGTLAGAVVVVGLVVGYGVKELVPSSADHDVSPVGTSNTAQLTPSPSASPTPTGSSTAPAGQSQPGREPVGTSVPSSPPGSSTSRLPTSTANRTPASTPPPLRPDPNLPQIPLPDLPRLLGPFLPGQSESEESPSTTPSTSPNRVPPLPRSNSGSAGTGMVQRTD
ncbi:Hsp70 family protein [Nocardia blacklockiae]|uniref:Hsp70 family protein n=1 Tax=Nocardia blacklockiae TaxID=480036 RepID=UPI00189502F3|nr:Hsp70 family protein [Nocardia blacklockiae]MBF6172593.1 Hsp70 family protein [Nocardia blacklockiae]